MIPDLKNNGVSVARQSIKTRNLAGAFKPDLRQKKAARLGTDLKDITFNDGKIMSINNRNVTLNVAKSNIFRAGGEA